MRTGVGFTWGNSEIAWKEEREIGKLVLFDRYDTGREESSRGR